VKGELATEIDCSYVFQGTNEAGCPQHDKNPLERGLTVKSTRQRSYERQSGECSQTKERAKRPGGIQVIDVWLFETY